MKKKIYQMLFLFMFVTMFGFYPLVNVYAEGSSGGAAGTGDGASGAGGGSSKLPGDAVAGVRMTVVDRYGKMVSGTHTVDFVNKSKINDVKSSSMYKNTSANRHKGGVIDGNLSWGTSDSISVVASPVNISFSTADRVKLNGKTIINYLGKLAKTNELYNNWITKTGYSRANINYNQHYIIVEPTLEVVASGKHYYGTATELAKLIQSSKCSGSGEGTCRYILSNVAREYLGPSACYDGEFSRAGKKNNGVTLAKENTFVGYISSNKYTSGPRFEYKCNQSFETDSNLYSKFGGKYNGNAVDVFYMASMIKEQCDINNPEHFHKVITNEKDKNYDNQDYISNEKTQTCCEQMAAQYGHEYVEKRYPICGECEVNPSSTENKCNKSNSGVVLNDVLSTTDINTRFACLYKGVSSKKSSKYNYKSREAVRKSYKEGKIGKYCEVYCIEDVIADFPDDYKEVVRTGGTFVWPSYNKKDPYQATVSSTKTCKVRFRQQEWLSAFQKGNKSTLLKQLKTCLNSNLNDYAEKYKKEVNPILNLSYYDGTTTIKDKTLVVAKKANGKKDQTITTNCPGCVKKTSGLTTGNVESQLNAIANQINSKVLTVNINSRYVLPENLFQYANKVSNELVEKLSNSQIKEVSDNNKKSKYMDTGSSKLKVNDDAKEGKYNLTINYSGLSTKAGKFKVSGNYVCKYEATITPPPDNSCDYNEPKHFETDSSGPNGENCCEYFAKKYGTDSDKYQELVKRGDCPDAGGDCDPGDPNCPITNSCKYPEDLKSSDVITKKKCCSMCLVDKTCSADDYKKYCSNPTNVYCPQDCVNGVCNAGPMTKQYRTCLIDKKMSPSECMTEACYGGNILIYRPISLIHNEAFPGAEKENRIWSNNNWYYYSNWAYRGKKYDRDYYVDTYITNNRGVKEYAIYNMEPMYTIKMDSKTIRTVRSYNKSNSYDDFKLKCNKNGRQCRSDFVKQYATGCGTGNWYDCAGISVKRGD